MTPEQFDIFMNEMAWMRCAILAGSVLLSLFIVLHAIIVWRGK